MIKMLGFIPRRPDIARATFREYYEMNHVPLALRNIRSFTKYVRNHVIRSEPRELGFDCLPEWWFDDPETPAKVAAWIATDEGQVIHRDEANFMDQPRMVSCAVREELLVGPARDVEAGAAHKLGVALTRAGSATPAAFEAELANYGNQLISRNKSAIKRVCIDVPLDPLQEDLPLHALFSVWTTTPEVQIDLPKGGNTIGAVIELTFEAIETPPSALGD